MPGLLVDGRWVAPLEIAEGYWSRMMGLAGRSEFDGALLLRRRSAALRSVHTFGMRFAIDVAHCSDDLRVLQVATLEPNRRPQAAQSSEAMQVIEARAGAFAEWELVAARDGVGGSQLGIGDA